MLLSIDALNMFIEKYEADLIIVQNITFASSAYITEILKRTHADLLLWTLSEPVIDGGRLRLNSMTGAFSAGYAYQAMRDKPLQYMIGLPSDSSVKHELSTIIEAAKVKHGLKI